LSAVGNECVQICLKYTNNRIDDEWGHGVVWEYYDRQAHD